MHVYHEMELLHRVGLALDFVLSLPLLQAGYSEDFPLAPPTFEQLSSSLLQDQPRRPREHLG